MMNDAVEEIKKRLDIVEFVGQYLTLKKVGINYSACCPFHEEKTPSFMVSGERQSFRCFGCGEGGDLITFFQKIEGLNFPEALNILGERTGVQVSFRPKEELQREKSVKDKLFAINLIAAKYFKVVLRTSQGSKALDYLHSRGLSDETIDKFKIGYANPGDKLIQYFTKNRYSFNDLGAAGHPERFRYRIMFPIFDVLGQVVGFSGRILEDALPEGASPNPKYLNTPETPIFHKSKVLYGLNLAKESMRKKKRVVVVEGQMDVAMSHEAGISEVVASSGTALTEEHLKILSRYTPNVIFSFDEDEAGQKAAHQAVQMALTLSLDVKLTHIDGAKDVGELVQKDKSAWPKVVESALPPVEWVVAKYKSREELSAQDKKAMAQEALGFISRMQDEIEKAHYITFLSKTIGVPEIAIEKTLLKVKVPEKKEKASSESDEASIEESFVAFLIYYPKIVGGLSLDHAVEFKNKKIGEIYKQVLSCYDLKDRKESELDKLKGSLERDLRNRLESISLEWDAKITEDHDEAVREFVALKSKVSESYKEKIKSDFARQIAEAEAAGNSEKVKQLMRDLQSHL